MPLQENLTIQDEFNNIKCYLLIVNNTPVVFQIEMPRKLFTISKSITKPFNVFAKKYPILKEYKPDSLISRFDGIGNYLILSYSLTNKQ